MAGEAKREKIKGLASDVLYFNEASEIDNSQFEQLMLRCRMFAVIDYNPSMNFKWIKNKVLTRPDARLHITTYKDNPFLPDAQVKEIERLKEVSPEKWQVYGLGLEAGFSNQVFTNYKIVDFWPTEGKTYYGLDFGFQDPCVLAEVKVLKGEVYARTHFYLKGLTESQMIERVKRAITRTQDFIICDSSEPGKIHSLKLNRLNAEPTVKGAGSILTGINQLKSQPLFIHKDSTELIDELENYQWKRDFLTEQLLDEPEGIDHAIDAIRYAFSKHKRLYPN